MRLALAAIAIAGCASAAPSSPPAAPSNTGGKASDDRCAKAANVLAHRGRTTDEHLIWREQRLDDLCRNDVWSDDMLECVEISTHDQLSCAHNLTPSQRVHWDWLLDRW